MKYILVTSKTGKNYNKKITKYHKFDGKDTFCNGFKNNGLKYEKMYIPATKLQMNNLEKKGLMCKNCLDPKNNNKLMAESTIEKASPIAKPKEKAQPKELLWEEVMDQGVC